MTIPDVPLLRARPILLAVAAPAEARAVLEALGGSPAAADQPWALHSLTPRLHLVVTGIGKSNAAGAVARVLDVERHAAVLSIGVAGSLPRRDQPALPLRTVVAATASIFADEGLQTDDSYSDVAVIGFPLGPPPISGSAVPAHPGLLALLGPLAEVAAPIATVSTCSGTDVLARQVAQRTGAVAEAMEGAAVALVAARLGVPAGECRIISNSTGRREDQRWDLRGALATLTAAIARLAERL
jgi:futalosine hydrolase